MADLGTFALCDEGLRGDEETMRLTDGRSYIEALQPIVDRIIFLRPIHRAGLPLLSSAPSLQPLS